MYQKSVNKFLTFDECIVYVKTLNIDSLIEWRKFKNRPSNIPSNPSIVFKKEWISWAHWLSSDKIHNKNRKFYSFKECREISRGLGIISLKHWHIWSKLNNDNRIPSTPNQVYKDEWISWTDWLGNNNIGKNIIKENFLAFDDARKYVHSLNIKNQSEWNKLIKPVNIPSMPHRTYKKQWKGYGDWLGTGVIATQDRIYISFEAARLYIRSLELNGIYEFNELCRSDLIPVDIPKTPNVVYKELGWIDYYDFLGCEPTISKGELKIRNFLECNKINFVTQKSFKGCKFIKLLKFDFYLPDMNICIEYDGKQHFESIEYFGGDLTLSNNIKKDSIKDKFCKNENITLIRIKYDEDILNKLECLHHINVLQII